jgi:hypothetical protein
MADVQTVIILANGTKIATASPHGDLAAALSGSGLVEVRDENDEVRFINGAQVIEVRTV